MTGIPSKIAQYIPVDVVYLNSVKDRSIKISVIYFCLLIVTYVVHTMKT